MKALSILQPWAWLIVHGHKRIENRKWPTSYRGRVLIHAGKADEFVEYAGAEAHAAEQGIVLPPPHAFDFGGIVGVADLVDCVTESDSPWFFGRYGFVLANARPLPFRPLRGMLGLFNVDLPAEALHA